MIRNKKNLMPSLSECEMSRNVRYDGYSITSESNLTTTELKLKNDLGIENGNFFLSCLRAWQNTLLDNKTTSFTKFVSLYLSLALSHFFFLRDKIYLFSLIV